jgi:hypothetical protein
LCARQAIALGNTGGDGAYAARGHVLVATAGGANVYVLGVRGVKALLASGPGAHSLVCKLGGRDALAALRHVLLKVLAGNGAGYALRGAVGHNHAVYVCVRYGLPPGAQGGNFAV